MPFTRFDHNIPPPPDEHPERTRILKTTLNILGYLLMIVVIGAVLFVGREYLNLLDAYKNLN